MAAIGAAAAATARSLRLQGRRRADTPYFRGAGVAENCGIFVIYRANLALVSGVPR